MDYQDDEGCQIMFGTPREHDLDSCKPTTCRKNKSYRDLLNRVEAASGEWVPVTFPEISGQSIRQKQMSLHQASRQRGIYIDTEQDGQLLKIRKRGKRT